MDAIDEYLLTLPSPKEREIQTAIPKTDPAKYKRTVPLSIADLYSTFGGNKVVFATFGGAILNFHDKIIL